MKGVILQAWWELEHDMRNVIHKDLAPEALVTRWFGKFVNKQKVSASWLSEMCLHLRIGLSVNC